MGTATRMTRARAGAKNAHLTHTCSQMDMRTSTLVVPLSLVSRVCVYFVLLILYLGIVTVPGCPRVKRLQIITWGGRILTLHLNYVAGYTGPLLFLFERTHNYYVDNQGLVPWRLRRLDRSKVRSASLVKVLSDGKISWILWSQGL